MTDAGSLHGRDCIFLDAIGYQPLARGLLLKGTLNGNLCSRLDLTRGHMLPFAVVFAELSAVRITELEEWLRSDANQHPPSLLPDTPGLPVVHASFYELLPTIDHPPFLKRRICALTYDDVVEVTCSSFTFSLPTILKDTPCFRLDPSWFQTRETQDATAGALELLGGNWSLLTGANWYSDTQFQRWAAALM